MGRGVIAWLAALVIGLSLHSGNSPRSLAGHSGKRATPRAYARRLTLHRWHRLSEWYALDALVSPESGWQPCSYYPSALDCHYNGPNACGVPQATPCPPAWRGRLYSTRWAQVRWLITYVEGRYGDPLHALAVKQVTGIY